MADPVFAQVLVEEIEKLGAKQSFSITGGASMHLNHYFGASKEIATLYMHHEQACAIAAEGYARINGKAAVVVVTAGPGAINAMNGVFGAYTDSIPMIIISGQSRSDTLRETTGLTKLRQLGDQEAPIIEMVRPITKAAFSVNEKTNLKQLIENAWNIAHNGRPGPVWIDIPVDVQGKKYLNNSKIKSAFEIIEPPIGDEIEGIKKALQAASRPVIMVGTGVRLENQMQEILKFAQLNQIPISTAWTHDLMATDHPLFAGRAGTIGTRAGNFVVQNSDFLLVLGSRLNIRQVSYNWENFAPNAFKVWVDIDENELSKPFPKMDLKIHSSVRNFVVSLQKINLNKKYTKWREWCEDIQKRYTATTEEYVVEDNRINPYQLIPKIIDELPEDSIVALGDATACIVSFQTAHIRGNMRMFTNSGSASMGYDLPAAIGAACAEPKKMVLCIAGDGSSMMNIQELQTIAAHKLNIKILILSNDGYLSIKQTQSNFFGDFYGANAASGVTFPNFKELGIAFGINSVQLDSKDWEADLKRVLSLPGPQLMVANLTLGQEFQPRLKSKMTPTGIVTPSLDDMYPHLSEVELKEVRDSAAKIVG
jgi:acetolactate synthase I/II/III large subunit